MSELKTERIYDPPTNTPDSYLREKPDDPPLDSEQYKSSQLRHPKHPLVYLPQSITEITGPQLAGELASKPLDNDLTRLPEYVAKASAQLVAIEVSPLKDGIADPARTELVSLVDLHEQDGFLVPRQLLHLQRGDQGRMRLLSKTVLTALSLRPDFTAKTFDRPGK